MVRGLKALGLALCFGVIFSCAGVAPDVDGVHTKARRVVVNVNIDDKLNGSGRDNADWRLLHVVEESEVNITLTMAPGGTNQVRGKLTAYDVTINPVAERDILAGQTQYDLRFKAVAGGDYFIRIFAQSGASSYRLRVNLSAVDPCAACGPGENCVDGICVEQASTSCAQGCRSGKSCDERLSRCVWTNCVDVRCSRGQRCGKNGRCQTIRVACPRGQERVRGNCVPKCSTGETRVNGVCEPKKEIPTIKTRITGGQDQGDGWAEVILNRGRADGITRGMRGRHKATGKTVTITRTDQYVSFGKIKMAYRDVVKKGMTVTFRPSN